MKRYTDYTILILGFFIIVIVIFALPGCQMKTQKPVYVEYFKNGQILLPDYAVQDTVIVFDAKGFNEEMGYVEQGLMDASDSQLSEITYRHCYVISFKQSY